jgi:chromosome segregation ATPase
MGEMLLGKLEAIEKCCDLSGASIQPTYDPRKIRERIARKRRRLVEIEAENATLVEVAQRHEFALQEVEQGGDGVSEAELHVNILKERLASAQRDVRALDEKRRQMLAERHRLNVQLEVTQRVVGKEGVATDPDDEDKLKEALDSLEERKDKEYEAYQRKIEQIRERKDRLLNEKAVLEQTLKETHKKLDLILGSKRSRTSFALLWKK